VKRVLFLLFLISIFVFGSGIFSYAEKITILYTGKTHANIYPCRCPKSRYGGLARRATAVKDARRKDPDLLLIDSGSFFAGGVYDTEKLDIDLDKKRTLINIDAMEMMGYDVVAVGTDELGFGKEFLEGVIDDKSKIDFVSCNVK
jgi:5'-nucleotidase